MSDGPAPAQNGQALAVGAGAYVIWGLVPLAFQLIGRMGATAGEILAHRTIWAVPTAMLFVALAGQSAQVRGLFRTPRTLAWLALSALLIAVNWMVFIWAVNDGRVLETSLGYYLNPLLNMAVGALLFRERISRLGVLAIGLASIGVALQAFALGHLPWVSLALAVSFCGYGVVRRRVDADAQSGLLIECLYLAVPSMLFLAWMAQTGGLGGTSPAALIWLVACGPMTALPLVMFSWAARRIAFSTLGFIQFVAPTMTFVMGVMQGEPFTPLRAASFVFIWGGVAVFVWAAVKAARRAA